MNERYKRLVSKMKNIINNINYLDTDLTLEFINVIDYYHEKVIFSKFEKDFKINNS